MTIKIKGELEIDQERGVIYFHCGKRGIERFNQPTVLRICRLPVPIPKPDAGFAGLLDTTHMMGCNWKRGQWWGDVE